MQKDESQKIRARTTLSTNDGDWKLIKDAAEASGTVPGKFVRDAVVRSARGVMSKASGKGAKS